MSSGNLRVGTKVLRHNAEPDKFAGSVFSWFTVNLFSKQKKTEEVYLVNLEKDDQWFEDARDFLDKLLLIGTNKNLVPPRQPQEFSRVLCDRGTSLFCGSFILRNCSKGSLYHILSNLATVYPKSNFEFPLDQKQFYSGLISPLT